MSPSADRPMRASNALPLKTGLAAALIACRNAFIGVGLMSGVLNILYLTGSFFMLEVYDRVIPSRSVPTLIGLAILAAVLFFFQGVLDWIRARVLIRIGASVDESLSVRIYRALIRLPLKTRSNDGMQPLRDLDQLRSFLSSAGPTALFDMPWMPIYLAICFAFHPYIGIAATVGGLILISLTWATELCTRGAATEAAKYAAQRSGFAEASRRNAEVLQAMGMADRAALKFEEVNDKYMDSQRRASDVGGGLGALSKVLRMALQAAVLGIGGYLVIYQEATAGIIIAGSILTARAVAPVELAIAHWKGFVVARQSWHRLNELLRLFPAQAEPLQLPAPRKMLSVEGVVAVPPGSRFAAVQEVSFRLEAGQALGVIGPSASGKSSLARLIVGAWEPARGKVRLDGASLDQWSSEALGAHVGYLPQDIELFDGTVTQNIARFEASPDALVVVAAAKAAGVHELILRLPEGYNTRIGEAGMVLSAGQRQRVALARALYKDPFLVVLDEPYSNLDSEGEIALSQAARGVRARGGIIILIAHRPNIIADVDFILVLTEGKTKAFGPRDEILKQVAARPVQAPTPAVTPRIVSSNSR